MGEIEKVKDAFAGRAKTLIETSRSRLGVPVEVEEDGAAGGRRRAAVFTAVSMLGEMLGAVVMLVPASRAEAVAERVGAAYAAEVPSGGAVLLPFPPS